MMWRWVALLALAAATVAVIVAMVVFVKLSDNDSQFCRVAAQRLVDKETQIAQSNEYLDSPAGREETGLNTFIRQVSLPRLRLEVASDRKTLPDSCRDEYDELHDEAVRHRLTVRAG